MIDGVLGNRNFFLLLFGMLVLSWCCIKCLHKLFWF